MSQPDARGALILRFLRLIAVNNNRPWFAENRQLYDEAHEAFATMVGELIARIAEFDPSIAHLQVKDCTYRFYRDIRFSLDKSPFKDHFGTYIAAHGKKAFHGGYYLHLQPANCLIAGGAYCLPPKTLHAVRQSIVDGVEEYRSIVEAPAFRRLFPEIGEARIKTIPKGFPKDFAHPELIRPKDFSVYSPISDALFDTTEWLDKTLEAFRVMKPFLDFINYTIDDYE